MANERIDNASDLDLACIPSNYSRLIARELGLQVRDLVDLLSGTTLTVDLFLDEETLLTPRQQIQLLENSLRLTEDPSFGLKMGKRLISPTHGAMGFLVNSSPNLYMALKAFQTFLPTRMNLARLELDRGSEWLQVNCVFDGVVNNTVLPMLSEIFAVIFSDCAEFILGRPLNEMEIGFIHPEPSYAANYSDFLPGSVCFSAEKISVRIPVDVCEIANASANQESYLLALQQCEKILSQLQANKDSCKYRVQKLMLSGQQGMLNEEEIAATMFISKRTLARRLKQEGTHFRQVRDEILSQQAMGYLSNSSLSVDAIAALLNYHDSSNFRRAFKRWFNQTPDQYRKQWSKQ